MAKLINRSSFVALPVFVALIALLIAFGFPFKSYLVSLRQQRLFTAEELSLYNGTDVNLPILLAILGSVFDVTKGKSHYGIGGGYNHFAGRDASRAFVSGNFTGDGLTDSLRGLSSSEVILIKCSFLPNDLWPCMHPLEILRDSQFAARFWPTPLRVKSIIEWREFYRRSYKFVGKLVGRYYDIQGNPTKYLKGVEAKAARGAQLLEKQKKEEAKQPSCNSRWSQGEDGEVWCDDGFPRLVQRPQEIALTGKMSKRCACFTEDQLSQQGLEVYEGCDYLSKTCRV
ncbi:membrane-associated progesterone-binding protein 4 isoform X1 [Manihot esculenta]|uniref:membrane-associated progesterone-binding protein 4 isoform X1 n=1 Tax=Manihot esculenta TaxID=3983 RepID=UPI000B5D15CA|nr:membrane-associated progesterone-binding protein 4 isoform X1 [Manihot esculenta]